MTSGEQPNRGAQRTTDDPDLAVVIERLGQQDERLEQIFRQTKDTNGRVTELEIKERIRQDREEQKAIRDAAAEAAKYRIETQAAEVAQQAAEQRDNRLMRRIAITSASIGAGVPAMVEAVRWMVTGHP